MAHQSQAPALLGTLPTGAPSGGGEIRGGSVFGDKQQVSRHSRACTPPKSTKHRPLHWEKLKHRVGSPQNMQPAASSLPCPAPPAPRGRPHRPRYLWGSQRARPPQTCPWRRGRAGQRGGSRSRFLKPEQPRSSAPHCVPAAALRTSGPGGGGEGGTRGKVSRLPRGWGGEIAPCVSSPAPHGHSAPLQRPPAPHPGPRSAPAWRTPARAFAVPIRSGSPAGDGAAGTRCERQPDPRGSGTDPAGLGTGLVTSPRQNPPPPGSGRGVHLPHREFWSGQL